MEGNYQYVKLTEQHFGVNQIKYGLVDSNGTLYIDGIWHNLNTYLESRSQFYIDYQIVPKSEVLESKIKHIDEQIQVLQDRKLKLALEKPEKLAFFDTVLFSENEIY